MNIPKIPTIEQLRDFAQSYFDSGDCPTLQWEEIANGVAGQADREKNLIAINPNAEVNCIGCSIGIKGWDGYHYYESLKAEGLELTEGEQYFLTLLHEIGHFKKLWDPPEEWLEIKKQLEEDWPCDLEMHLYCTEDYINREEGLYDFQHWLVGEGLTEHSVVEDWSVKEFKERREEIRRILNTALREYSSLYESGFAKKKFTP